MNPDLERIEELRKKLEDYYGTAVMSGNPMAAINLSEIENMDDREIETEAEKCHIK